MFSRRQTSWAFNYSLLDIQCNICNIWGRLSFVIFCFFLFKCSTLSHQFKCKKSQKDTVVVTNWIISKILKSLSLTVLIVEDFSWLLNSLLILYFWVVSFELYLQVSQSAKITCIGVPVKCLRLLGLSLSLSIKNEQTGTCW